VQQQKRFAGSLVNVMDAPAVEVHEAVLDRKEPWRHVEGGSHRSDS
jgi:hypothetical protein